jgi:hypothetical protein
MKPLAIAGVHVRQTADGSAELLTRSTRLGTQLVEALTSQQVAPVRFPSFSIRIPLSLPLGFISVFASRRFCRDFSSFVTGEPWAVRNNTSKGVSTRR